MNKEKVNSGKHEMQKPHTQENCKINEAPHSHPDTDCGHRVNSGPGVAGGADLNIYEEDNGKRCVVSGGPSHNLDQDAENGPGVH